MFERFVPSTIGALHSPGPEHSDCGGKQYVRKITVVNHDGKYRYFLKVKLGKISVPGCMELHIIVVFMRPYEVWFAYCYRKVCLSVCLSVTLVNCGQTMTDRPIVTMGD